MSQFRKNPVSGEWVVIAPERAKRPDAVAPQAKPACPFDHPQKSGNWPPLLEYEDSGRWKAIVVPNKFPALKHQNTCPPELKEGPYVSVAGSGYHELLITRDHKKDFPALSPEDAYIVFEMIAERYRSISGDPCMRYLVVFANYGAGSGASQAHPHYQLLAMPVLPPAVARSLHGSRRYYEKHLRCVHCAIIKEEKQAKKRIVAENEGAIAIAPFSSSAPYEVRIFPKEHFYAFEHSGIAALRDTSALLQKVLGNMKKKLHVNAYNFLIHSAPLRGEGKNRHYHWHIEVYPKLTYPGGLELATGTYVNVIDPELAAKTLR
jgi:UDPglucose--hexose-1-phosphate uridylyltransferase